MSAQREVTPRCYERAVGLFVSGEGSVIWSVRGPLNLLRLFRLLRLGDAERIMTASLGATL